MPDQIQLTDLMRRALDANVQYLTTISRLAAECLQTLVASATTLSPQEKANAGSATTTDSSAASEPAAQGSSAPIVPTVVLEAEAGGHALGVFLVENVLSHPVSARIVVSKVFDPSGREVQPPIRIEPETITLESREQVLVRVLAGIDDSLAPGTDYRAEIKVPDLPGTRVPIVLRRRAALDVNQSSPRRTVPAKSKTPKKSGHKASVPRGRRIRTNKIR